MKNRSVLIFAYRDLFWNLGVPNSLCKIRRTALLQVSEIATCFVFYISSPFAFCSTFSDVYSFTTHFLSICCSLSQWNCHTFLCTVTQNPFDVSPSFQSESILIVVLRGLPLMTYCCYYVVWSTFFNSFSNIFSVELSHSSGVAVTQGSCNVFLSSQSSYSTLMFSFEPLVTHSHNHIVWTATLFSVLCFTHFLSRPVPLFMCNCYTKPL